MKQNEQWQRKYKKKKELSVGWNSLDLQIINKRFNNLYYFLRWNHTIKGPINSLQRKPTKQKKKIF